MIYRYTFIPCFTPECDVDMPGCATGFQPNQYGEWCKWDQVSDELERLERQIAELEELEAGIRELIEHGGWPCTGEDMVPVSKLRKLLGKEGAA